MKASSLSGKTIRPGSLNGFSYYYSGSRGTTAKSKDAAPVSARAQHRKLFILIVLLIVAVPVAAYAIHGHSTPAPHPAVVAHKTVAPAPAPTPTPVAAVAPAPSGPCAGNGLDQLIKVSISQRHMWACQGNNSVYDSPVITGMEFLAADLTPTGTYHIYSKQTAVTLRGSDSTGSWNDPVSYWMPFLSNKYGVYGFHDATWRSDSEFGNVDPNTPQASHGCVELPLASAEWLYNWSHVGTTLTIAS